MKKYLTEWKKFLKEEYENIDHVQNLKAYWKPQHNKGSFSNIKIGTEIGGFEGDKHAESIIESRRKIICPNAPGRYGGKFCCIDPEGWCATSTKIGWGSDEKEYKRTIFEVSVSGKVGIYHIMIFERLYEMTHMFSRKEEISADNLKWFDDEIEYYFSGKGMGYYDWEKNYYEMVVNPGKVIVTNIYQKGDDWSE